MLHQCGRCSYASVTISGCNIVRINMGGLLVFVDGMDGKLSTQSFEGIHAITVATPKIEACQTVVWRFVLSNYFHNC